MGETEEAMMAKILEESMKDAHTHNNQVLSEEEELMKILEMSKN